jgi:hypothetical protein
MTDITDSLPEPAIDGASLAAVFAAGIGAFAMGLFVVLHVVGLYSAPGLYGPAGGVSGRTAFAVLVWLVAWALLHRRWRTKVPAPEGVGRVIAATVALVVLGLVATFPPLWELL